jgi:hypothetical protein
MTRTTMTRGMSGPVSFIAATTIAMLVLAATGVIAGSYPAVLIVGVFAFGTHFLAIALFPIVLLAVALVAGTAAMILHSTTTERR